MSLVQHIQQILNTPISPRAQILGTHLAIQSTESEFWIRQQTYADSMRCSRSTISRALKELVTAGLLQDMEKKHLGRYKMYQSPAFAKPTADKVELRKPEGQKKVHPYQHIFQPFPEEKLNYRAKEVYSVWKETWEQKFPLLDGQDGRPFLISCVEEATQYMIKNRHKYDTETQVDIWLKTATKMFCSAQPELQNQQFDFI